MTVKLKTSTACFVATAGLALCLSACGTNKNATDTANSGVATVSSTPKLTEPKATSETPAPTTTPATNSAPEAQPEPTPEPSPAISGEEREEMLDVNGVRLSVKEAGTGRDMILIHGRTLSKESMDTLFDYYKDRYHVVSYDVRGHGATEWSGEFTLDDLSGDLMALIAAKQIKDPIVVGFSMGSYIALHTAERFPGTFSGMVLIGTRGARTSSPWPSNDEVGRALESFDNMSEASKVTMPVLVMTGENDAVNPKSEGEKVANALPDAIYQVVPAAQHEAYAGNPEFVFAQINGYLDQLGL